MGYRERRRLETTKGQCQFERDKGHPRIVEIAGLAGCMVMLDALHGQTKNDGNKERLRGVDCQTFGIRKRGALKIFRLDATLPRVTRTRNNLPFFPSRFIGRDHSIAEVKRLLSGARLVTLTGAGGCGKTTLALHVARALQDRYADGICWVELAPLTDAALIPQALLQSLGLGEQPKHTLSDTLLDALRDKELLLVLDNCEHLIDASAQLGTQLLQQCPDLHLLVTSREALNVDGEQIWIVPSLDFPPPHLSVSASQLQNFEAIALFIERARAVAPTFRLTDENAMHIARICQRVDGVPLAIELAAARVNVLSVEQIAARLEDALQLLTQGKRSAPPRHQTLRATLDWSYELLSPPEQMLFRRLAVFAGGFTPEAVEGICANDELENAELLDLLASLVNKSLLMRQETQVTRLRMLEPIRQYARAKLVGADELETFRNRHLSYFHAWVIRSAPKMSTPEQLSYLAEQERELDNLRATLEWALSTQPVMALRLVWALTLVWNARGYITEALQWGNAALQRTESDNSQETLAARGLVLNTIAFLTMTQGDNQSASTLASEAVAILRTQNDPLNLGRALSTLGSAQFYLGQLAQAQATYKECLRIARETNNSPLLSLALGSLAGIYFH